MLALEALPKDVTSPERPFLVEAEVALYQALLQDKSVMVFRHDAGVTDAAFDPQTAIALLPHHTTGPRAFGVSRMARRLPS